MEEHMGEEYVMLPFLADEELISISSWKRIAAAFSEISLVAATLVNHRQHVDAACGVIDSSQDTHTTANGVSSLQS